MRVSLIVAADESNGVGLENQLLCHLPTDLKYFKEKTTGHHVLMGRKTFESIGRPLPNRVNMVLSQNKSFKAEGVEVFPSMDAAIKKAIHDGEEELFITGGGNIYRQSLLVADTVYLTRIHANLHADTFFPRLDIRSWSKEKEEFHDRDEKHPHDFTFITYQRMK